MLVAGCGAGHGGEARTAVPGGPVPIGLGPRFHPGSLGPAARDGRPVGGMHCRPSVGRRFGAHLEIFARGRVVAIPPGIGIAPPRVRDGAFVRGGRCSYPLRTVEPTGLIEVAPGRRYTLGDLFTVWGQPLGARRLAGFTTPAGETVRGYVAGRRWNGDVRAIPLSRHSVLALAVSGRAFPHPTYAFPAGF